MKNFTSVFDIVDNENGNIAEAMQTLIQQASDFKTTPLSHSSLGKNKRLGCIFLNPSMRTRISTQIAAQNLGMEVIVFNVGKEGWAMEFEDKAIMSGTTVEHVRDAAPILGNYFDVLAIRSFPSLTNKEEDYSEIVMEQFKKFSGVPIISLESAILHPLQSLTDILTMEEVLKENASLKNRKPKVVLTWAPHVKPLPHCVPNSFAQWVNHWGKAEFVICHPKRYELSEQFTRGASITTNQDEALKNADFVYVKNWSAYKNYGKMYVNAPEWMLTENKMLLTNQAKVMHCLPVRRNVELSDEVLDSKNCITTLQASNRVWAAQAVLYNLLMAK